MIIDISSFSNPKIKYIKSLSKSKVRKAEGVFLMEGRPELDHALNSGMKPKFIAYTEAYISTEALGNLVPISDLIVYKLSKPVFDDLTYQNVPNNFIAAFDAWPADFENINPDQFTVILDRIEKPGNLGAIIRTCDAMGVKQIIVCDSEIDLFNPNVLRNSRGGIFNVNIAFCESKDLLNFIHNHQWKIAATVISDASKDFRSFQKESLNALFFGAESSGLSEFWCKQDFEHMIIPMQGIVDSLNLSVSVAVVISYFKY